MAINNITRFGRPNSRGIF